MHSKPPLEIAIPEGPTLANHRPLALLGGVNVMESRDFTLSCAEHFAKVTEKLSLDWVFKASFDKANRSSVHSFRGPGLDDGLKWLAEVAETFSVPVMTDVHEPHQVSAAAEVCRVLQLPAFLCRQTDLVRALAESQAVIHVKKAQFLSVRECALLLEKFAECGTRDVMLCERGTLFGYNNLVVDVLNFGLMKRTGHPVVFDVTHSLQQPGALRNSSGGRREGLMELARAGVACGIAGLFLEAHPEPDQALCDGPSALHLDLLSDCLTQIVQLDAWVKSLEPLDTT
ncbi:MAG: 3-deoxy-8-phosphooctulonate synthase [Gammaproteobacteria bacterium AqS3]|nr:3-deoxy-8-phosphooctulonate synthase [Gammaproteobacteria bacterium AqS3]